MSDENHDLEEIRRMVRPILEEHGITRAEIFGSYARNEEGSESDVDILVELGEGKTLTDLAKLKEDLEEALEKDVDVLTYDSLHPDIREKIFDEAVEI